MNSSHTDQLSAAMRGSRNFRHGGGGGGGGGGVHVNLTKKTLTALFVLFFCFFLSPRLILQMSNGQFQKEISFFKVPEGVQIFPGGGGGGQLLTPYRNPNNLRFSRGVRTPWPLSSGSALGCYLFSFPVRKMMRSPRLGLHMCSFSCNFVVCFQSSPAIKSFLELTA